MLSLGMRPVRFTGSGEYGLSCLLTMGNAHAADERIV